MSSSPSVDQDFGEEQITLPSKATATVVIGIAAGVIALVITVISYRIVGNSQSTIVLPGGITYLGPTPPELQPKPTQPPQPSVPKFTVQGITDWIEYKGKRYPYRFYYPESLTLSPIPNDPTDGVGITWGGRKATDALLLTVINLNTEEGGKEFLTQPKKGYVENWWRRYSNLTGATVTEFTSAKGVKGYKAKFQTSGGPLVNDDVFLEVKSRPELMIHLVNEFLDPPVFERIVESVTWGT